MTDYYIQEPALGIDFTDVCKDVTEAERMQYRAFSGEPYDSLRVSEMYWRMECRSWALYADGRPIVVGGFLEERPGVYRPFCFATRSAFTPEHIWAVTKAVRAAMDDMLQKGAHRLECLSLSSHACVHRWYRRLGLTLEGTLRGFGAGGEDAVIYSRVRAVA